MNFDRIQWLEKYAKDDPTDPFPRYALALEWVSSDPGKAMEILDQLMFDHPHYIASYYQSALLKLSAGKVELAKVILEKGIEEAKAVSDLKTIAELRTLFDEVGDV